MLDYSLAELNYVRFVVLIHNYIEELGCLTSHYCDPISLNFYYFELGHLRFGFNQKLNLAIEIIMTKDL